MFIIKSYKLFEALDSTVWFTDEDIEFCNNILGKKDDILEEFEIKIKIKYHGDSHIEGSGEIEVSFTAASFEMQKRNFKNTGKETVSQQLWNVTIGLEEV